MRENNPIIRWATAIVVVLLCLLAATAAVAAPGAVPGPDSDPDDLTSTYDAVTDDLTDLTPSAGPAAEPEPSPQRQPGEVAAATAAIRNARVFRGWGFDSCHTPSIQAMQAWLRSDYRAVGVYYAGHGRTCRTQAHLTRDWVRSADRMGWRIMPVYVGSQPPCVFGKDKPKYTISRARPWQQGTDEALDAVTRAALLGFGPGSPLYLDMEAYSLTDAGCAGATLSFVRGWNRQVRAGGYRPGFYSSSNSGITHMNRARAAGMRDMPSAVWFARWHVPATVHGEPRLSAGAWLPHRRIHQYAGNVFEKHGGHRLSIDRNRLDAPVAFVVR
ncbi:DUF1906 domain-containing protein [Streptomyces sp. NBC_01262]|uniref:DUF1906 domain-containing protein n=1 Tax=Streptomyces sp. NBC_01262 TaxID=2903803 RepID=UPI002E2F38D3|nr:DUF1906 domain-containing protein [Streptomyces sp. NBC_01262]